MKLLLTHVPRARQQYYGARALARLQELVEVVLHDGEAPLDPQALIAAARDVDLIIADRSTPVPGEVFAGLPRLRVVMRSAIDIRNIDVAAASKAGVLVTHAEAGFVKSVIELTVGFLVDLSRGITRAATAYHEGRKPEIKVGRQLSGSVGQSGGDNHSRNKHRFRAGSSWSSNAVRECSVTWLLSICMSPGRKYIAYISSGRRRTESRTSIASSCFTDKAGTPSIFCAEITRLRFHLLHRTPSASSHTGLE